ncbi:MAG TPA: hypothetical protein VL495_03650 [Edaphobacter sp.]|jgi:hypothetical protein|nr:hypothetical protein [Edaphobacter sp.]
MIRGVMEEARQFVRETPGFATAFLLLLILCIGVRCAVFYQADGEQLKLQAENSLHYAIADGGGAFHRMQARAACPFKTPGFTVIVGLRQYEMELSVPAATVQALWKNARVFARGATLRA